MDHNYSGYAHGCRCAVCKKAAREYHQSLRAKAPPKHGHSGYTNYGCRCKVCSEAAAAYHREWSPIYHRAVKREKLAYLREWREQNREMLREQRMSVASKASNRCRQNRRRARKRGVFVEDVEPHVVYEMHGGRCGICGQFVPADNFHVDHILPLSRGGLHAYINCQPAHPSCNWQKGSKLAV